MTSELTIDSAMHQIKILKDALIKLSVTSQNLYQGASAKSLKIYVDDVALEALKSCEYSDDKK